MTYNEGYLYLFGGHDQNYKNTNALYRYNLLNNNWELINTKGQQPLARSYHEMCVINENFLLIYGGIKGHFYKIEEVYNDIYILSLKDNVWSKPIIGGSNPPARFAFSFNSTIKCGFSLSGLSSSEVLIFGGIQISNYLQEKEKFFKLYILSENDAESKHYWTIRDLDFNEGQNDENFLILSEKNILEYKEKIDNLELEISSKETFIENMKVQIEDIKKQIYKSHGFIDDQSQTLEEYLRDLENQKNKLKENFTYEEKIVNLKMKLKLVMQRKLQKTMDFFCDNQNLFIKYYDSLKKMNGIHLIIIIINNDFSSLYY